MQQGDDLMGDGVSLVFQFGYFGYLDADVLPVIQHILEAPGSLYSVTGTFYKKVEELTFLRYQRKPSQYGTSSRASSVPAARPRYF
jgi:hypothetical protein